MLARDDYDGYHLYQLFLFEVIPHFFFYVSVSESGNESEPKTVGSMQILRVILTLILVNKQVYVCLLRLVLFHDVQSDNPASSSWLRLLRKLRE